MAKTMKSYRLEQFTLDRLAALAKKLDLTETSALEYAISMVYFVEVYDKGKKRVDRYGQPFTLLPSSIQFHTWPGTTDNSWHKSWWWRRHCDLKPAVRGPRCP